MCMSCKVNGSRRRGPCACDVNCGWCPLVIPGWLEKSAFLGSGNVGENQCTSSIYLIYLYIYISISIYIYIYIYIYISIYTTYFFLRWKNGCGKSRHKVEGFSSY